LKQQFKIRIQDLRFQIQDQNQKPYALD